jgi:hypothetical protein
MDKSRIKLVERKHASAGGMESYCAVDSSQNSSLAIFFD